MPKEVINSEEKRKLVAINMRKAFGEVSEEEEEERRELERRKKLQEAIDKQNR